MNHLKFSLWLLVLVFFVLQSTSFCQFHNSTVKHPEWSYDLTLYEVNLRQYSQSGSFKEFEKHLPRLRELGVGILWFMPIHPIGELNRKGTLGSYYSIKDYFDVNPEHGTLDDFKSLVKKIHEEGMFVILDWVGNHTSWDNPLAAEHPDWYTKDSSGNFIPPVADWADVIDLNYDNMEMREYMISALKFWVEECDIDGYRCDVAGMVPMDFWNKAREELDNIKPVFMLAEDDKPDHHEKAFDMTYSWELHHYFNQVARGEKKAGIIRDYFEFEKMIYSSNAFRMRFTSNHDENSWNGTEYERMGDAAETFAALTFVIPGQPLIYSGQEAAYNKRLDFFEKDPIKWADHKISNLYSSLTQLKKNNPALHSGEEGGVLINLSNSNSDAVLSFARVKDGNTIVAVFNLSASEYKISFSAEGYEGEYFLFDKGDAVTLKQLNSLTLLPWEYKIYIMK